MFRIPIRSRFGSAVVGVLGVLYLVSATATLLYYLVTNWGANGLTDLILQLGLAGAAAAGFFFVMVAADNLGITLPLPDALQRSRPPRDRQPAPASGS
jgi:hypothetical protein